MVGKLDLSPGFRGRFDRRLLDDERARVCPDASWRQENARRRGGKTVFEARLLQRCDYFPALYWPDCLSVAPADPSASPRLLSTKIGKVFWREQAGTFVSGGYIWI